MSDDRPLTEPADVELRRQVPATPERVFSAWTNPDELVKWWGPDQVQCIGAEIDLKVGGRYRIGNRLPDQSVLWIHGVFEQIDPPNLICYTWSTAETGISTERVTVRFEANAGGTEIIVRHARIPTDALLNSHRMGWLGCLDSLETMLRA